MTATNGKRGSAEAPRKRLLTLGGCNVLEAGKKLNWLYDHTHIWNVTWASLGSEPFDLVETPADPVFRPLDNLIRREASKEHGRRIAEGGFDLIFISGQMTQYAYVARGDRVMVDFTTDAFIADQQLQGRPRPSILTYVGGDCERFTWHDSAYLDRQRAGFERMYETMFKPAMAAGGRVVVYHQRLLADAMDREGEIVPLNVVDLDERTAVNRRVAAIAAEKPDILVLETPEAFSYTAEDAPWGRSELHPVEEHYVGLAAGLARLDGLDVEAELSQRYIADMRQRAVAGRQIVTGLDHRAARSEQRANEAEIRAQRAEGALERLRQSLAWRITKPLRVAGRLLAGESKAPKAP